jgi:hydrogenase maturation protease
VSGQTPVDPGGILVLGLGNILLRDEGLGVRALERLQAEVDLPSRVRALDGGTMGLDLLPYIAGASRLLILDALRMGGAPGSLVRLEDDEIPAALAIKLSVHQVGLQELLAASRFQGTLPARITLLGIEPETIEWGLDFSPPVSAALDALVDAAVRELRAWGVEVELARPF